ncbi:MAG: YfcC family protein [Spirochaetaceae bacterium]|nr:MAG: YfcC family protein [Spirochaetaceae bacterium]
MNDSMIRIGLRAFVLAFVILILLMIVSGVLTRTVPAGLYDRVLTEGRVMIEPGSFRYVDHPGLPVWRWFTAPVEVLFAEGSIVAITIILFLIFVGASFTVLEHGRILHTLLALVVRRFRANRFMLMAVVIFFFMSVAAVLGVYESMVPLIVFIVPLAHYLGWDSLTGLGMSLLALAFGFSAAITNPFTIGVAQRIAELPLFSGAWLRVIFFLLVYVCVLLFVRRHALAVERDPEHSSVFAEDQRLRKELGPDSLPPADAMTRAMKRAILWFGGAMGTAFLFVFATARHPVLSDLAFPLMALLLLIGGIGAGLLAGMGPAGVWRSVRSGALAMLPGVLLVMMSLSVRHIVHTGGITDTILHSAARMIEGRPPVVAAFLIYAVTLGMNFFVGSASAKAFLMMPILTPLADLVGITRQTAVLAFGFGDGFSNMLYPSNALLLIGLGFTVVSYPRWIAWTIGLQAVMFLLSMVFLYVAVLVGFGPF